MLQPCVVLPESPTWTCQNKQLPIDAIICFDDHYCSKCGYYQIHQLPFNMPPLNFGTQQLRQHYKITQKLKIYFAKRYFYFSLFQYGIQLDQQSWYSVLAQPISLYLIQRLKYYGVQRVFQPFCGVGGFAVHAAGQFKQLVVNDYDKQKIKMLKNNLHVYGKGLNQLRIYNQDYALINPFQVDAVLICPPWGGSDITLYQYQDLDELMVPKLSDILNHCKKFSKNIILQMPKTTNLNNLLKIINLCFLNPIIKIQKVIVDNKLSQIFVFIGNLKFTQVDPNVYNIIMQQISKQKNPQNYKTMKKNLKKNIEIQQNYDIFHQIYKNTNIKPNKHIYFDES